MNNLNLPPEHRICGRLTNWDRDIENLAHYAKHTGDERLQKRIARLSSEIDKTLRAARRTRDKMEARE